MHSKLNLLTKLCLLVLTFGMVSFFGFTPSTVAQGVANVSIAPGQTRTFEVLYRNRGDVETATDANLKIFIGSELIVDETSFTDQFDTDPTYPVSSAIVKDETPAVGWGYVIDYLPRSATTVGTPSGVNGLSSTADAILPPEKEGRFRFRATLRSDIFNGQRPTTNNPYTSGQVIGPTTQQGARGLLQSLKSNGDPADNVPGEIALTLTDNTIQDSEIGNCPTQNVALGATYTCQFPLTGSANFGNTFILPAGGYRASTENLALRSEPCTIINNGLSNVALQCTLVPTFGLTVANQVGELKQVNLYRGTSTTALPRGQINITNNILNETNLGPCAPSPTVGLGATYNCSFPIINNPSNLPYSLPVGGIIAGTDTLSNRSAGCVLVGSPVPTSLSCTNIPTIGLTITPPSEIKNVNLYIGTPAVVVDKGDVTITTNSLTPANLGDCPTQSIDAGSTYNCSFPITNNTAGLVYSLPSGGVVAGTDTLPSRSPACTLVGTPIPNSLSCSTIPTSGITINGTSENKNVNLYFGTSTTANDKGDVTLNSTVISDTDLQICNFRTLTGGAIAIPPIINIGSPYNCFFDLINPSGKVFTLPTNGIRAGTDTLTNLSQPCTLTGSPIPTSLVCNVIPTAGLTTAGVKDVKVYINASTTGQNKGSVNVAFPLCPNGATNPPACDICPIDQVLIGVAPNGQCRPLPALPIISIPLTGVSFTPAKNTPRKFGESPLAISVVDSRITPGSTCSIKYRQYRNTNSNLAYLATNLNPISATNNATTGCTATLPPNNQTFARYEFEIRITDNTTGITSYPSLTYGIDTAYSLNFGAIGVVGITAS